MPRRTLTERQKKLLKLISENLGNNEPGRTMVSMMLEAGYEESTARQQASILAPIAPELDSIVAKMERHRERVLQLMIEKADLAPYHHLTDALDKMTKNIQLLSGRATENIASKVVFLPPRDKQGDDRMDADASPEARP